MKWSKYGRFFGKYNRATDRPLLQKAIWRVALRPRDAVVFVEWRACAQADRTKLTHRVSPVLETASSTWSAAEPCESASALDWDAQGGIFLFLVSMCPEGRMDRVKEGNRHPSNWPEGELQHKCCGWGSVL